ncbi:MAG TPA: 5-oxoprolinase subunit PxpB [Flavisolibacter sp.]|nr:5-oxoprolinase subunit PxpB [Flavisolibacter sp.]
MLSAYTIFPLGDSALTIHFGNKIDDQANEKVLQLFTLLQHASPLIKDVVPAYSSLTVYYDAAVLHKSKKPAFETIRDMVVPLLETERTLTQRGRRLTIPVCYAKKFAMDIEEMATQKNISVEALIETHTAAKYRVYMIGFLPGFAYMGKVHEKLITPRRKQPRTVVPAGSVGIAGEQTGIYPLSSPGGWNIIGRTPLKLFDANRNEPVFFQPGDEVKFYSITEDEFENYQGRIA